MSSRRFWLIAIPLLVSLPIAQILSVRDESPTWDEGFEIASGYHYLTTGRYLLSREQPAFARAVAALPLLPLHLTVPPVDPVVTPNLSLLGRTFLFDNTATPEQIIFPARLTVIFFTFLLALAILLWTRRVFSPSAALIALALFVFDPNIIAVGRYVKNDIHVTLFAFLACAAWGAWLERRRPALLLTAGLLAGLAFGTKYSSVYLVAAFPLLAFLHSHRTHKPFPWKPLILTGALGLFMTLLVFAPETWKLIPTTSAQRRRDPSLHRVADASPQISRFSQAIVWTSNRLGLLDHPLLVGLADLADHNAKGHDAYLLGRQSHNGWWYYFPVAFFAKTPVATLLAILIALALAAFALPRLVPWPFFVLLVPALCYLPFCVSTNINTGERHLFPLYPAIFILTAALLIRLPRWVPVLLALAIALETHAVYPHYLAFFNRLVGGPEAGPHYLVDSNIDWGQDALRLRRFLDARYPDQPVCFSYFGPARLSYYKLDFESVPTSSEPDRIKTLNCLAAISVTPLQDVYVPPGSYSWLRAKTPIARIGYTIYVYDFRQPVAGPSLR